MNYSKIAKLTFAVCLVAFAAGSVVAQNSDLKLLGRFSDGDVSEFNYRIANTAFTEPGSRIILRICSQDDLLTAVALAAGIGATAGEKGGLTASLERFRYQGDVFYAAYSGCESKKDRFNTVEYWLVKNNAKLEYDSEINADDISVKITRASSKKEFDSVLKKLRTSTDDCVDAAKLIVGDHNSAPSKKMRKNIEKAERSLGSNTKCGAWRSVLLKGTDIYDSEPEEDFPLFVIVSKTLH
jgi:hypothetical protein